MKKIILDCDLMRYRDSGLYHYCLNLGHYAGKALEKEADTKLFFYVPPAEKKSFTPASHVLVERKWHNRYFNPHTRNCQLWHAPFQSGRIPRLHKQTKVLLTIHDLNCLHEDKTDKERRDSLLKTQRLIDRSHALVCISEHCRKDVLQHMNTRDLPVYVIHNGTHQVNAAPLQPSGYRPERPFLFTMGYVNRKKNFHTLVALLESGEHELLVAGKLDEADYVEGIKKLAKEKGVADRLKILGPVSEADKAWYLSNCMAFMLPSLAEGFGAPVVEAMKFGKPLFLSHLTSLPEIGGDCAFYFRNFDPDHMRQVLAKGMDMYSANGLAEKIKQRGKIFDWEEKAREYISVYRSLL